MRALTRPALRPVPTPGAARPARARGLLASVLGLALCTAAGAQGSGSGTGTAGGTSGVYRCGPGQYSQTPCPGGQALATDPAPDPAQQRQGRDAARQDARMAERLRAERKARERAADPRPAGIAPVAPPPSAASAPAVKRTKLAKKGRHGGEDPPNTRRAFAPDKKG